IRVTAYCEFPMGVSALVDVGLLDDSKMRSVIAVGRRAMVRFEDGEQGGVWIKPTPRIVDWPDVPQGDQVFTIEQADRMLATLDAVAAQGQGWSLVESNWPEPLNLEMAQFVAACENPHLGRVEIDDALATLRALEAGARSMRDGGRCVRVQPRSIGSDFGLDDLPSSPR
ncbi:MAG TPA: hypothetical protein VIV60_22585, partial [Polyangiaceae bacterium]